MGGFLERFRARYLNLDRVKSKSGEFENTMGFGFPVSKVWLLPRFLFKQCLTDGASAMQVYYDADDNSYHMLYGLPHGSFTWYDMVPAPTEVMRSMVKLLRRQSGLVGMRWEAGLKYIYLGRLHTALCVSRDESELVIYFGDDRPKPFDKNAGDVPGVPSMSSKRK